MKAESRSPVLHNVVGRMPEPGGTEQVRLLEGELAATFGTAHAVAVSSGTAALHTALVAAGIGPGDEVLAPAATVVMTLAAVAHAGARSVLVDSASSGVGMDVDDLATKIGPKSRAVIPVHLGGRCGDLEPVLRVARRADLRVIEDACQAQGSTYQGRNLGTVGDVGCFSLHGGKVLWSGEGGYLLTDDLDLATRAAGFRTHQRPDDDGVVHMPAFGHNYRLAEPLAALARINLARFEQSLARRRRQARLVEQRAVGAPGIRPLPPDLDERPNGYSALARLTLPDPRAFARRLASAGIPNSVGTFGLTAAHQLRLATADLAGGPCPSAATAIDTRLAVLLTEHDSDAQLGEIGDTIRREADQWTA